MTAPADETRTGVQRQLDAVLTIYRCPICGARNSASRSDVEDGVGRCVDHGVYRAAAVPDPQPNCPTCPHVAHFDTHCSWRNPECSCRRSPRPTAAVPDPRFRDQLAEAARATVSEDDETEALDLVYAWLGGDRAARTLLTRPEYDALTANIAQALADRSAAEVEARVQAAANQRAAEVRRVVEHFQREARTREEDDVQAGGWRDVCEQVAAALEAGAGA